MEKVNLKLTSSEYNSISSGLEKDLIALFKTIQEDVEILLQKGYKENWSIETLLKEIEGII
jgi:hypothetical protein